MRRQLLSLRPAEGPIFALKSLRQQKYGDAVLVADNHGREVVVELRKSGSQDREIERLQAENARLREGG